ncbi:hypothetical protein IQ07DRAFT_628421 [Pyrenochaeta sp. DS3sAY3a]|nr:hypothetical protein IQ07DRAFT_628421 [Pyrenochaeta sp. DS3sAY3a]
MFSSKMQAIFALSFTFSCFPTLSIADDCRPVTWSNEAKVGRFAEVTGLPMISTPIASPVGSPGDRITIRDVKPGELNCRAWGYTYNEVNYYTCTEICNMYEITTDYFFSLNPTLETDCSNIQPKSEYCIDGYIEPLRALDGLCGPKHNNATCLGTDYPCCNANTFTCGASEEDCADGTCFEGGCLGDKSYSTDGTCGSQHGDRLCAGKWGDCCNFEGKCGTGASFCSLTSCQSGNCTRPSPTIIPLPWQTGTTPDGSCGGPNKYTCNVVYGGCCNKNGQCGIFPVDCGAGCGFEYIFGSTIGIFKGFHRLGDICNGPM